MTGVFELQIAKFVEKAKGNIDLVVRRVALDVFTRIVVKSPVDTGRFKSNWQVAIGSIPAGTLGLDPTIDLDANGFQHPRGPGGIRSVLAGNAVMSRVQAEALKLEAGQVIYLVNNLEYARPLEYGHSKQAPNGMVRLTIQEWNNLVNANARAINK